KQAVYSFRNADSRLFESLLRQFPERVELLQENRRSRAELVGLANDVFGPLFGRVGLPYHALEAAASYTPGNLRPVHVVHVVADAEDEDDGYVAPRKRFDVLGNHLKKML